MSKGESRGIKIRHLSIKNFKAFESLEIDFPPPRMEGDPDVIIMGSKNGLGKTSVLEAISLLFFTALAIPEEYWIHPTEIPSLDIIDLLIHSGTYYAEIAGSFSPQNINKIKLGINRNGKLQVKNLDRALFGSLSNDSIVQINSIEPFLFSILSINSDPFIFPPVLYFHSNRKIHEGYTEIGDLSNGESLSKMRHRRFGFEATISKFKLEIVRLLMSKAELFEELNDSQAKDNLERLNGLLMEFANGRVDKLRTSQNNRIEIRITPTRGGPSYPFDGLSSGQKEIISTLFLIWKYTKDRPGIVLIDEPELHLNAGWSRKIIGQLHKLAPHNQYIIATHSEDVFSSVPEDRRILLTESGDE